MHRTSSTAKSLKIQRETVRVLASGDLRSVQGGAHVFSPFTVACPGLLTIHDCPNGSDPTVGQNSNTPGSCPQLPTFTGGLDNPINPSFP
jgi:hypothetical protein